MALEAAKTLKLGSRSAALAVLLLVGLAGPLDNPQRAVGDTSLPATITSDQTWTASGSPYTGATVTIASGVTVTVEPGATVKVAKLIVNGTLDVNGTAQNPAVFTSSLDSAPGQWNGIVLNASSSSIEGTVVRYAKDGITIANGASPTVTGSTVRDNLWQGIEVHTGTSAVITNNTVSTNGMEGINVLGGGAPTISGNTVSGNTATLYTGAINYEMPNSFGLTGQVNIHDNTVSDNGGLAGIRVWQSQGSGYVTGLSVGNNTITGNAGRALQYNIGNGSIPADIDTNPTPTGNGSNAVYVSGHVTSSTTWQTPYPLVFIGGYDLVIDQGATLTLAPGQIMKAETTTSDIDVWGALSAVGTAENPIRITSLKDDSVGGDTNGDGTATAPAPGNWGGIQLGQKCCGIVSNGTLDRVELSYGGRGTSGMFNLICPCSSTSHIIRRSKIQNGNYGITVAGTTTGVADRPLLEFNTVKHNTDYSINKSGNGTIHARSHNYGSPAGPPPKGPGTGNAITPATVTTTIDDDDVDCGGGSASGSGGGFSGDGGGASGGGGGGSWFAFGSVNAETHPVPDSKGSSDKDPEGSCPEGADPVSLATGAFVDHHTDLRLTSKGDPLEFRRSYTSNDTADAGFGPGWAHSGVLLASEREDGGALVRQADGRRDLYIAGQGGSYIPPPGVHDALVKEVDNTFKLTTEDRHVYDFDSTGRIATITDDHGQQTTFGYNGSGRLSTITDPSGQVLTFTYNASNRISKVTDSTGREVNYTYTAAGELDTVTDPLGGVTNYDYDSAHRITQVTDPRGIVILRNTYDGQGRVTEQRDGLNNLWTLAYGTGQTTVTDPRGGTKIFGFDSQKRITSLTSQLGHQTTYGYNAAGDLNRVTRPGSAEWNYIWDSSGNLTSATGPEGGVYSFSYDAANRLTSYTDPRSKTWTFTWSGANDLIQFTNPKNEQTTLIYNSAGQPTSATNPRNKTWTYTYDSRGNLTQATNPLNHSTSYAYNTRSQMTSMTEPGKPAETYTRNARGDLLSVTSPAGHTTSYEYDQNGHLIKVTDPALKVWRIERNAMERPTAYVDPANNRIEVAYNATLLPTQVTDRRGKVTTYTYNLADHLTRIDKPAGGAWQFAYDARGNRTQVTNPRGHITNYTFDRADRLTQAAEPLSTTTTYAYDALGNLTSVTDPRGNLTSFVYDELSRPITINQPLSKQTSFTYDAAGNLATRTTGAGTRTYAYDDADRLTSITQGGSTLRSYTYDAADRVTAATDAQQKEITLGYNADDLPTSINDGRGQTSTLAYDSRGNLTRQVDGRGTTDYAYDDRGRMTSLTDPQSQVINFLYDAEGNLTRAELPNGAVTTLTYDSDERLTQTTTEKTGQTLESLGYAYDLAGNRTSQTDRQSQVTTYAHDALNRIIEFDPPTAPATTYAYDAAGNRTSAGTTTYSYDALNRLTSASDGTTYSYDGAGRMSSKTKAGQTTNYTWDALDQLTGVNDGLSPVTYSYDALGRRSERTQSSATETAHYSDLSDTPTLDTAAGGAIARSWVQGPRGLVEERASGATSYPIADEHGDVTAVTNQAGAVSTRQTYDPWGVQVSGPEREFGFLGAQQRRNDPSTDMLQMGFRPYDPMVARFIEEDRYLGFYGLGESLNRYGYVLGNPLQLYDLGGEKIPCPFCDDIGDAAGDGAEKAGGIASDAGNWAADRVHDGAQGVSDFFNENTCGVGFSFGRGVNAHVGIEVGQGGVGLKGGVGFGAGAAPDFSCTFGGSVSDGLMGRVGGCITPISGHANMSEEGTWSAGACAGAQADASMDHTIDLTD